MQIIDNLKPGAIVTLRLFEGAEHRDEQVEFLGVIGDRHDPYRRAKFRSKYRDGSGSYMWEAFRFGYRWCYGGDNDRLQLVSVDQEPVRLVATFPVHFETPFEIADALSVQWIGKENYLNDDQEVKLTVRELRGLMIEAASQARWKP